MTLPTTGRVKSSGGAGCMKKKKMIEILLNKEVFRGTKAWGFINILLELLSLGESVDFWMFF